MYAVTFKLMASSGRIKACTRSMIEKGKECGELTCMGSMQSHLGSDKTQPLKRTVLKIFFSQLTYFRVKIHLYKTICAGGLSDNVFNFAEVYWR